MTLNPNWYLNATGQFTPIGGGQINISTTTTTAFLGFITASLSSDVSFTTTSFVDGPSVAQGTSGTWFVTGYLTVWGNGAAASITSKLWDGTSTIASGSYFATANQVQGMLTLSGVIANPAGNLRMSASSLANPGLMKANMTGANKDCAITAIRIG